MFKEMGFSAIIDITFVAFLIYVILIWFKKSRAAFVLTGIIIIAAVFLLAQQFNLVLTTVILQGFFAVILIACIVIFQEEIRRFFEQVAVWSLNPRTRGHKTPRLPRDRIEILVKTLIDLAHEKIGALIVLRGKNLIMGHLNAGIELNGRLSEAVLKSIFDPHSIGHDGAVVIEGDSIVQFGAHLPLSKSARYPEHGGTRHAAALGLSEMTDALCLVVSEEKGTVSSAHHGKIHNIKDSESLWTAIEHFYGETAPPKQRRTWANYILKNFKEKLIAVGLAAMLWFVQVYGSTIIYKTYMLPVEFAEINAEMEITSVEPQEVEVTFAGPRRELYFLRRDRVRLFLKTLDLKEGVRTIKILPSDLIFPQNISPESIDPARVTVHIQKMGEEKEKNNERKL